MCTVCLLRAFQRKLCSLSNMPWGQKVQGCSTLGFNKGILVLLELTGLQSLGQSSGTLYAIIQKDKGKQQLQYLNVWFHYQKSMQRKSASILENKKLSSYKSTIFTRSWLLQTIKNANLGNGCKHTRKKKTNRLHYMFVFQRQASSH